MGLGFKGSGRRGLGDLWFRVGLIQGQLGVCR